MKEVAASSLKVDSLHIPSLNLLSLQNWLRLLTLPPPVLPTRERELLHTLRLHLNTIPRIHRRNIISILNNTGMEEMLMQMVHIFEHTLLATNNHIINCAQMLRVFGQTHTSRMRNNWDVEFCGHEEDGDDFVNATKTAGVDLADVDCARGEKLFEHYSVLAHFAGCDANVVGFQGIADGFVAED